MSERGKVSTPSPRPRVRIGPDPSTPRTPIRSPISQGGRARGWGRRRQAGSLPQDGWKAGSSSPGRRRTQWRVGPALHMFQGPRDAVWVLATGGCQLPISFLFSLPDRWRMPNRSNAEAIMAKTQRCGGQIAAMRRPIMAKTQRRELRPSCEPLPMGLLSEIREHFRTHLPLFASLHRPCRHFRLQKLRRVAICAYLSR